MLPARQAANTPANGRSPCPARKKPRSMSVSPGNGGRRYSITPASVIRQSPTAGWLSWRRWIHDSIRQPPSGPIDEVSEERNAPPFSLEGFQDAGHDEGQHAEQRSQEQNEEEQTHHPRKGPQDHVRQNHAEEGDEGDGAQEQSLARVPQDERLASGEIGDESQDS